MIKWILRLFIMALATPITYAEGFFCPATNTYVEMGSDIAAVQNACGKPQDVRQQKMSRSGVVNIVQWYYKNSAVPTDNRPPITLTFKDNKLAKMTVAEQPVQGLNFCRSPLHLGMTQQEVANTCNPPSHRYNTTQQEDLGTVDMVWLTYQFQPFQPKTVFRFEAGKLVEVSTENEIHVSVPAQASEGDVSKDDINTTQESE